MVNSLGVGCLQLCPTLYDGWIHALGVDRPKVIAHASFWLWLLVDLDPVVLLRVAASVTFPISFLKLWIELVGVTGTLVALL